MGNKESRSKNTTNIIIKRQPIEPNDEGKSLNITPKKNFLALNFQP